MMCARGGVPLGILGGGMPPSSDLAFKQKLCYHYSD